VFGLSALCNATQIASTKLPPYISKASAIAPLEILAINQSCVVIITQSDIIWCSFIIFLWL